MSVVSPESRDIVVSPVYCTGRIVWGPSCVICTSLIALLKDDKIWFVVLRRFSLCTRDCQGKIIDKLYCYLNKEFGVVN